MWIVLAAVLLASTGVMSYLYIETKGRLSDTEVSLASTRSDLQGAKQHASKLDGQLQKTSDELQQTEGDLKEVKSEAAGLEDDLKTAEVCLKGLADIGTATSPEQMVQVILRVGDECRSAYRAVGDRFPT